MRRLAFHGPLTAGARVALDPDAARHAKVLRLRDGDPIELFDGEGTLARGVLVLADRASAVDVEHVERAAPPRDVVLVQALAKGDKLDLVVRMATEIGVRRIYVADTEHAVPVPDARRVDRWRRIAREAARQSEQLWTPQIEGPLPLLEIARLAPERADRRVLSARGGASPRALEGHAGQWLVVGPEGGLSADEERALIELGFCAWTLPTGILRTETAAPVALGALLAPRAE